jgi:hypothetical protein
MKTLKDIQIALQVYTKSVGFYERELKLKQNQVDLISECSIEFKDANRAKLRQLSDDIVFILTKLRFERRESARLEKIAKDLAENKP